ncbi:hypothetical protein [Alcaligenes aquatilis]|uniref:hypothetical protein n=1 Tax=Alcaligenes aquatilis TaxID=323284 RepID=UPI003F91898C
MAFNLPDIDAAKSHLPDEIEVDVRKLYQGGDSKNYVLYLQNASDWHVSAHLTPFLASVGCLSGDSEVLLSGLLSKNLYVHVDDWGSGHVPPKKSFLGPLLRSLIEHTEQWGALFEESNMKNLIESANRSAFETERALQT